MKMKSLIVILAVVAALWAIPAWGETATVKGTVLDEQGKPMVGAIIEFKNNSNGSKTNLKVDSKGRYFSLGFASGVTYDVSVMKDGKQVFGIKGFPVTINKEENILDFDLSKERARAEKEMSPEEKARREALTALKGISNMVAAADAAQTAKNYDEALRLLTEASQKGPGIYQVWARLGECNMAYGRSLVSTDRAKANEQFQAAITAYTKAIELQPTEGGLNNNMADAYIRLGKPQDALEQYKTAIQKNPNDPKFHFNMGAVLTNMGKVDEATAAFDKAITADPNYAEAYYQRSVNMMAKAKVDPKTGTMSAPPEVAAGFNKYLELAPNGPNAEGAKGLLASIGAKVETSYGKKPAGAAKKK